MRTAGRRPRVFIYEDTRFEDVPLSRIIEDSGCELVWTPRGDDFLRALGNVSPPLALIVATLHGRQTLDAIACVKELPGLEAAPILVLGPADGSELDLWELRSNGVVGLVDTEAPAEHVRFRISQIAYSAECKRRFTRVPCRIPAEFVHGRCMETGHVVSLSAGGLAIACANPIQPNTQVQLCFALAEGDAPITIWGRAIHLHELEGDATGYRVGIFFYRPAESVYAKIDAAVSERLSAWDAAGGFDSSQEPGGRAPVEPS